MPLAQIHAGPVVLQYLSLLYIYIFLYFVLKEPAEPLLSSTVGVVMVTCRRLKKRNDRFGLFSD